MRIPFHVPGRRASIAAQLLAVFAVAALLTGALIAVNVIGDFRNARAAAVRQVGNEAAAQARGITGYYAKELPTTLASLLEQPGMTRIDDGGCEPAVTALNKLIAGGGVAVVRANGTVACSAGGYRPVAGAPWLVHALEAGYGFGGPLRGAPGSAPMLGYAVSFPTPRGPAALVIETPSAHSVLTESTSHVDVIVVDGPTGRIIDGRPKAADVGEVVRSGLHVALVGHHNSLTTEGQDGVRRIYARAPVHGTSWVVLAGIPEDSAFAIARHDLRRNLVLGALLLGMLLGLGTVVYRRLARPMHRLRNAIDNLAASDVDHASGGHVPESGPRELGQLGQAFNAMVDARVRSEARLASLVRHASDLVLVVGLDGRISYATPSVESLLGLQVDEVCGSLFLDLVADGDRAVVTDRLSRWHGGDVRAPARLDFRLVAHDGVRDVEARVQNLVDDPAVRGLVITCHDITDRKRTEQRMAHAAMHDSLTDLPNRALVLDRLEHLMARTGRNGTTSAVLFVDLDRFKLVNDSNGHAAGDELLVKVSERLSTVTRPGDTLGRFGGDEFVLICESLSGLEGAAAVAERLLAAMLPAFQVAGQEIFVTASIGIALALPGDDPADLLRDADAALYRAKERGRAGWAVFDDGMRQQVRQRLDVGNRLRHAVNGDGLFLDYQPIVALGTERAVGVEALLRWRGDGVVVPPDEFIPVAEETGLIVPIGEWVIREACRQLRRWQDEDHFPVDVHMSVNVSARQLAQPDFVNSVARALEETGLAPGQLTLEVTESVLMHDRDAAASTMAVLRALGVSMSIDDFGTGFSSLGYLDRLPVDELKIDRSFVAQLGRRGRSAPIIESVIDLAHAVGLAVVAEGVEDALQARMLAGMGCDFAQGFHFSRPVTPEAALDFLISHRVGDAEPAPAARG